MSVEHGGRVTLRLASVSETAAEYDAELAVEGGRFSARAVVSLPGGAVDVRATGESPPQWLVDLARTTLRGAYRTAQAGEKWPRRLSRWREAPGEA